MTHILKGLLFLLEIVSGLLQVGLGLSQLVLELLHLLLQSLYLFLGLSGCPDTTNNQIAIIITMSNNWKKSREYREIYVKK
jgi:hypothetical protein